MALRRSGILHTLEIRKAARTGQDATPEQPLRGMLEAMDGRKQAHMDVLVAVPRRGCSGDAGTHAEDVVMSWDAQQP
ncbi:MAG: hypothetical protein CMG85_16520 [Marinobacter sp.]|nr:hypothetical protein [Marinobacter sp.]